MNEEKPACLITFSVSACAFHQMDADYAQPGQQIFTRFAEWWLMLIRCEQKTLLNGWLTRTSDQE